SKSLRSSPTLFSYIHLHTSPNLSVIENLQLGAYTRRHDRLRDDIEDVFRLYPEPADRAKSLGG
ncbi:MAG: hypothetical protein ACP5VX_02195, partial [Thermogladius sp.]